MGKYRPFRESNAVLEYIQAKAKVESRWMNQDLREAKKKSKLHIEDIILIMRRYPLAAEDILAMNLKFDTKQGLVPLDRNLYTSKQIK